MSSAATFPGVDAVDIRRTVGAAAYDRARPYARTGAVLRREWDSDTHRLVGTVQGTEPTPYRCSIDLVPSTNGYLRVVSSRCSCPVGSACKHIAATLLAANAENMTDGLADLSRGSSLQGGSDGRGGSPPVPAWKSTLRSLSGGSGSSGDTTPLALQFEVRETARRSRGRWQRTSTTTVAATPDAVGDLRLTVRPVVRTKTGRWSSSNLSWSSLQYQVNRLNLNEDQVRWFGQFGALDRGTRTVYFGGDTDRVELDDFASPLLWNLLAEARRLGIDTVPTKAGGNIRIAEIAQVSLDATRADDSVRLRTTVTIDGADARGRVSTIGNHGLYAIEWVTEGQRSVPNITLAPTSVPLGAEQRRLVTAIDDVVVPDADVDEFFNDYYPALRQQVTITSSDASVEFPAIVPPVLVVTASYERGQRIGLSWEWEYRSGSSSRRTPVHPGPDTTTEIAYRDTDSEQETLAAVAALLAEHASEVDAHTVRLSGLEAAEFSEHLLPALAELERVRVDVVGDKPDYRELTGTPTFTVSTVETEQRDWFDLGVLVHVDGVTIPFGPLFTALSKQQTKLLLVDNSYFSLKHPAFDRLRALIDEAGTLEEWQTGARISRYQAGLWAEFEDLADETHEADAWRATVGGLLERADAAAADSTPLPAGLTADLRAYQRDGFQWLTFLWHHGLGGILADDMGLGKTVQTLALIAHARWSSEDRVSGPSALPTARPSDADASSGTGGVGPAPSELAREETDHSTPLRSKPFLVVAPTSVVSNWVTEAARFTPGLRVAAVTKTQTKSRTSLAELWRDADVVVTSYTLFRLDFQAYQEQEWAGLILDEAQFVKNHTAKAHQCARELDAPFKLAITGTPMENKLMELWALFSIVAPGLFPSSRRFDEDYVRPIAAASSTTKATPAAHGAELLARLRRRIRPLMMRRTKELVAPELPAKQEQVLQIELAPKHRKLYDTVLQRERQKLLGLIDDLDRNRFIVFRSLTLLRMLALDATLVDQEQAGIPSSKLDALFEQLEDVLAEGHRALIFSQFTSYLSLVAARLETMGIEHAYLDGSTTRRAEVIATFKSGTAPLFLISLKAGGFGLNLTEADYVFMLDPWWNPATESQAIDRTHRIGQDKNVMVYRMVASGTIEEKVMALKDEKSKLFDAVLDEGAAFSSTLTADDIRGLLQ